MLKLILGIFLLAAPFLALGFYKNKEAGFIRLLFFVLIADSSVFFLSQIFGVFYYVVVASGIFAVDVCMLIWILKTEKENFVFKIPWVLLAVILISFLSLWQVHYNYTGKFNMVNDKLFEYHQAENMKYEYPYFSDEWYAVALAKEAIRTHSLPVTNPFDRSFFMNPELFFHSFVAGIMVLLDLDPLTKYIALSIFANTLILVLVYMLLRINKVSRLSSAVSSVLILYITSASNLPGIWNFLPVTAGIIFSLLGLCFISLNYIKLSFFAFLPVLLFYPPLFIFYGVALAAQKKDLNWLKILPIIATVGIVSYFLFLATPAETFLHYIFSNIFYNSFTGPFYPRFNFYDVIPLPVIVLACFGLIYVYKNKKWLFYQLVLGISLWVFYAFSLQRIIIGYERVLYLTGILACITAGFGQDAINSRKIVKLAQIAGLAVFVFIIPFYTQREAWRGLILTNPEILADSIPMAPANNYLTQEDLRVFSGIKEQKFFSMPWKGAVIGVATDNFPVLTKGGTITMGSKNPALYQQFIKAGCAEKEKIVKEREVKYIYSAPFSCPGFLEQDKSSEGFILYKYD